MRAQGIDEALVFPFDTPSLRPAFFSEAWFDLIEHTLREEDGRLAEGHSREKPPTRDAGRSERAFGRVRREELPGRRAGLIEWTDTRVPRFAP